MVVVGVALLAGAVGLLTVLRSSLLAGVDETAKARADEVEMIVRGGSFDARLPVPVEEDEDDQLVQVVDAAGRVVAASPNALDGEPISNQRLDAGTPWVGTVRGLPIDPDDNFRILADEATSPSGPVTIYVATELKEVDKIIGTVRRTVVVGATGLLALMGALTWFLVGRALRPVESIRSQVADISAAALDRRVPEPEVNDEVGRLARTMNAMLGRLQASNERQQRFAADASHELRSPLASARAQLEVAVSHPASTTVEALAADLLQENERMERLVADLLLLTRTGEGHGLMPAKPVDIDELVLTEVARLLLRTGVEFEMSHLSGGRTRGHPEHLGRVVRNLVENAARHATSTVVVELRSDGDEVELVVADDGPGIPPEDRQRVFDRFTRLDEGRSRDHGGFGLGLAIAREVVLAHGGRIWVDDVPPAVATVPGAVRHHDGTRAAGGARFVVRLPVVE